MSLLLAMVGTIGGIRVNIGDLTISESIVGNGATATYTLTNAGAITSATSLGGTVAQGSWINPPSAAGAAYEVFVTNSGDALSSGTESTWLALNTTQSWSVTKAGIIGTTQPILNVQIRRASDLVVLDTATITLSATKT